LNEVPGFHATEKPLTRPSVDPHLSPERGLSVLVRVEIRKTALSLYPGEGLPFLVGVEVRETALSLGERVARCRRFHQPERAGPSPAEGLLALRAHSPLRPAGG